jgi:sulfite reductase alpha subunit-like flavoprotein
MIQRMSTANIKSVRILYATATGTAEDVAYALAQRYVILGADVSACSTVDSHTFPALVSHGASGTLFVFIIATAGDGEAPKCMTQMWTEMRVARLSRDTLSGVNVAVFGLGDRGYQKFNAAARRLATRIVDIGARMVVPLALGDESAPGGYDTALLPWIEMLFGATIPSYEPGQLPSPLPSPKPHFEVQLHFTPLNSPPQKWDTDFSKWRRGQVWDSRILSGAIDDTKSERVPIVEASVSDNLVLTTPEGLNENREVRHIALDISKEFGSFSSYVPGDAVHVMPRNRSSAVQAFFELVDVDPHCIISLAGRTEDLASLNIRTPCKLADFVAAQLDLSAMPRRRFFERLAAFAANDLERDKLVDFSSAEGDALIQYAYREKRTILMALRDFPSARPPLADLIDMIPSLRSRAFSIASSRFAHGKSIHICAAIVRYTTPLRFARVGVCSSLWLHAGVGDVIPVYLERGSLRFSKSHPAILVGPGTGVAPIRSFVSSLPANEQESLVPRILYVGCRHARGDYLYEKEWVAAVQSQRLSRVETAFSRDDPERKVYVQNLMLNNVDELWKLIDGERKGIVYIAGAAGDMPKAVRSAITSAARKVGGLSEADAERYVSRLQSTRRLQIECW